MWFAWQQIKLIYSEKATKSCEISTLYLSYVVPVKCTVEILQIFLAFSEYMNFNKIVQTFRNSVFIDLWQEIHENKKKIFFNSSPFYKFREWVKAGCKTSSLHTAKNHQSAVPLLGSKTLRTHSNAMAGCKNFCPKNHQNHQKQP